MKEIFLPRWAHKLYGVIDNPNAHKIIILVHGFTWSLNGPDSLFEELSIELQTLGYAVCRFNCIGTPPSEWVFQEMTLQSEADDTNAVLSYIKDLGYENISLLWESMWWSIIALLNTKWIKNVIFWYSAFDFIDSDFKDFLTHTSSKELERNGFLMCAWYKVGKTFIQEIPNIVLYNRLQYITCPVLFLHWDSDDDVPYTQSQKAFDLVTHKQKDLVIVEWAGHCFPDQKERAILETIGFLKKYL